MFNSAEIDAKRTQLQSRREILFDSLSDPILWNDTKNKQYFKIESVLIPQKIFYTLNGSSRLFSKITFKFSNIDSGYNEKVIIKNNNEISQNILSCHISIDRHLFEEKFSYFIYDGRLIDRFFKCKFEHGLNRNDITINIYDRNGDEILFDKNTSDIRLRLCFYS